MSIFTTDQRLNLHKEWRKLVIAYWESEVAKRQYKLAMAKTRLAEAKEQP